AAAGDNTQAEKLLRTSLDLAGHTPDTWVAWLSFLAQTNQRSLALQELDRLKKELPIDRRPLTLARCYDVLHLSDQAAKAFEDVLQARPNDFIVLAFAADFYRRADQPHQAQKLYEQLLDPSLAAPAEYVVTARRNLAILLAAGGSADRQKALALLSANTTSRGDTIADERIRLFIQGQDPQFRFESLNRFQETLRRQQPTPEERMLLAQMFEAAGNLGQARLQLSEVLDEAPAQPQYLVRCARLLIRTRELDEAAGLIARLESLEPTSERVRNVKAALTRARKDAVVPTP